MNSMMSTWPQLMGNPVRAYDWGSVTALAALQGKSPTGDPQAELWMGAHHAAPSIVLGEPLDSLIAGAPAQFLGKATLETHGPRLPFLLKILAIEKPLSLQVHPTAERARDVFEGRAMVLGSHEYVDPYPKPELLYALEPVEALCGFRSAEQAAELFESLQLSVLKPVIDILRSPLAEAVKLERALEALVRWPEQSREVTVSAILGAVSRLLENGALGRLPEIERHSLGWVLKIGTFFPADPLVLGPLLLRLISLSPGETMFVPAGTPHAYLTGLGVEIMANSDNVLRAGLTTKEIAVEELLHVLDGGSNPLCPVPSVQLDHHEVAWLPGIEEFGLSRIRVPDGEVLSLWDGIDGPTIVLCTRGCITVSSEEGSVVLRPGESAFVPHGVKPLTVSGSGELFRAFPGGLGLPRASV